MVAGMTVEVWEADEGIRAVFSCPVVSYEPKNTCSKGRERLRYSSPPPSSSSSSPKWQRHASSRAIRFFLIPTREERTVCLVFKHHGVYCIFPEAERANVIISSSPETFTLEATWHWKAGWLGTLSDPIHITIQGTIILYALLPILVGCFYGCFFFWINSPSASRAWLNKRIYIPSMGVGYEWPSTPALLK